MVEFVYLCGAITNNISWQKQFEKSYNFYRSKGYAVISPLNIYNMYIRTKKEIKHKEIQLLELNLLVKYCKKLIIVNEIYRSVGSKFEVEAAKIFNIEILNYRYNCIEKYKDISIKIADKFEINYYELFNKNRESKINLIRKCLIHIINKYEKLTYTQIGYIFNLKRVSVYISIKATENLLRYDDIIRTYKQIECEYKKLKEENILF